MSLIDQIPPPLTSLELLLDDIVVCPNLGNTPLVESEKNHLLYLGSTHTPPYATKKKWVRREVALGLSWWLRFHGTAERGAWDPANPRNSPHKEHLQCYIDSLPMTCETKSSGANGNIENRFSLLFILSQVGCLATITGWCLTLLEPDFIFYIDFSVKNRSSS